MAAKPLQRAHDTAPRFAPLADEPGEDAVDASIAEARPEPEKPEPWYVVDTSATPIAGERTHDLQGADGVIRGYTFKPHQPMALPFEIAAKFLKHDGFIRVDEAGNRMVFRMPARRPEELLAGEKFRLEHDESIARFDELTTEALCLRAAMLPKSELVVRRAERKSLIAFILQHYEDMRRLNSVSERDEDPDGFTPPVITEDDFQ